MGLTKNTACKLVCLWAIVWIAISIGYGYDYANNYGNDNKPPLRTANYVPPTLTFKKLEITKNSLTYDGVQLDDQIIYFRQEKPEYENDAY